MIFYKKQRVFLLPVFCFLFFFSLILSPVSCSPKSDSSSQNLTHASQGNQDEVKPLKKDLYLDSVAKFISGKKITETTPFQPLTSQTNYKVFVQRIEKQWRGFQKKNVQNILAWSRLHLKATDSYELFYPFSGPDILNALVLFPDASQYLLVGLEPPGILPQLHKGGESALLKSLWKFEAAMNEILNHSFFHTLRMEKKLSQNNEFNNVFSILLFFMARMDYEFLSFRYVHLDHKGNLATRPALIKKEEYPAAGIELTVRQQGRKEIQKVIYISSDISDAGLSKHAGVFAYMQSRSKVATMLKAASYLMYRPSFDDMRNLILSRSSLVLTDPSGIPYHYFSGKTWNIDLYGRYVNPIKLFSYRCQPDLKKATSKFSKGTVPFEYGYSSRAYGTTLILARRQATAQLGDPKRDGVREKGEDTFCQNGKTIVKKIP